MADIFEGDSGLGAAITPEEWAGYVLEHLSAESVVLASGARRVDTAAKQVHIPRLSSDGQAGWFDELDELNVGDPVGDDLVLTPRKCASLTTLSNEAVMDSNPSVLEAVGTAMTRAVSLEADRALFIGGGSLAPAGFLNTSPALQPVNAGGTILYSDVVTAGGSIAAYGGRADSLYVNPRDYTRLQLATDGMNRPLIQPDATRGGAISIAGMRVHVTPGLGAGTALVAQADQLVVAVREDASVTFSSESAFTTDATQVRVVCRVDGGVADANGVCVIS